MRRRLTSSSVRSRTRVSAWMPVSARIFLDVVRPLPKMDVRLISTRFSRGMSTPDGRAMSALPLLVSWIGADDHHAPMAADDLALLTDGFDARPDLHWPSLLSVWLLR